MIWYLCIFFMKINNYSSCSLSSPYTFLYLSDYFYASFSYYHTLLHYYLLSTHSYPTPLSFYHHMYLWKTSTIIITKSIIRYILKRIHPHRWFCFTKNFDLTFHQIILNERWITYLQLIYLKEFYFYCKAHVKLEMISFSPKIIYVSWRFIANNSFIFLSLSSISSFIFLFYSCKFKTIELLSTLYLDCYILFRDSMWWKFSFFAFDLACDSTSIQSFLWIYGQMFGYSECWCLKLYYSPSFF